MKILQDDWFNAQMLRTIGHTPMGGADLGECYSLIDQLNEGDFNTWYTAWVNIAEKIESQANSYALKEQYFSAMSAYLRSSNYYRTSFFFLDETPDNPRIKSAYLKSKETFENAIKQANINYKKITIPFGDVSLPGYLFLPTGSNKVKPPLLIDTGGGDATKEECFFNTTVGALQRGWASFIFDGPGQGELLRIKQIPFRADWHNVITAVIDHLLQTDLFDTDKITLYGSSFGGYLAPKAAAHEYRIEKCIANPGVLNATKSQILNLPQAIQQAFHNNDPEPVNHFFNHLIAKDKMMAFMFESRKVRFGAASVYDMLKICSDFNLEDCAKHIQAKTLILDNELEHITKGEAKKLYDQLSCPKQYHLFKAIDGHGGHCQPISHFHVNEYIFNWLMES